MRRALWCIAFMAGGLALTVGLAPMNICPLGPTPLTDAEMNSIYAGCDEYCGDDGNGCDYGWHTPNCQFFPPLPGCEGEGRTSCSQAKQKCFDGYIMRCVPTTKPCSGTYYRYECDPIGTTGCEITFWTKDCDFWSKPSCDQFWD